MVDRERIVPFSASLVHLDGNALIVVVGELDMATAPDLASALEAFVEGGPPELVFDLSGLSFMDSSGLAVFTKTQRRLREQGRTLSITAPQPNVLKVFEIAGLMEALNIVVDRERSGVKPHFASDLVEGSTP
jgi:anti-sigma B factor antagonist